ncbi:MAG: HAD-IB family phosphatase [Cyanophyceae cyanobacterium]
MKRAVFCDFDGTITATDTFAGMSQEFAPDLAAQLIPQMYARTLTLREGVQQLLASIPSQRYAEVIAYADNKPIRPGLDELLDFLESQQVPFVVVSGGLLDMVKRVLSRSSNGRTPIINRVSAIAAVKIDSREEYLRVLSDFESNTELIAKVQVMDKYPADETVAIGDSVTDINMALRADLVFARDRLVQYMAAEDKPTIPWNDFYDVLGYLQQRWQ